MNRYYLFPDEMGFKQADLVASRVFAVIGSDSIFVPSEQRKYINRLTCRPWPDLDGEIVQMTPGEAARMELKRAFPDVRLQARKTEFWLLDLSPPMYFPRVTRGDLIYFDLKGAYWQLYRQLWLDVAWPRGAGQHRLRPVADRLENWKTARNTVIGISRAHSVSVSKGGRVTWQRSYNPFFNPHLWHTIQICLHEIASVAVDLGCRYIATDGYIFRNNDNAWRFQDYLISRQLDFHFGAGPGEIRGWGSYSIDGVKTTRRRNKSKGRIDNLIMPRKDETIQWLRKAQYLSG